jgi:hypothetical protein
MTPRLLERADRRSVEIPVALYAGFAEIISGLEGASDDVARQVRVSNISDTGWRLDGLQDECGDIAAGDLVALRLDAGEPLTLGWVVRVVPDVGPGGIVIGVRRIPGGAHVAAILAARAAAAA